MSIFKYNELNFNKVKYDSPEKNGVFYYSPISYDNEPFLLQTPKMICKNNLSELIEKKTNLEIEPLNMDFSFYDFLVNLDDKNIKETFKNNTSWFGKEIPLEQISDMYKRTSIPTKKDSKPKYSFKVPIIKDKIQCQLYDQKKICLESETVVKNTEISLILHIKGLKFLKNNYYCDIYISQIKVYSENNKYNILDKYAFNDKDDEEMELKELEKDLMLDEDFIQSMKNKDIEKEKLLKELNIERSNLLKYQENIKSMEERLNDFN